MGITAMANVTFSSPAMQKDITVYATAGDCRTILYLAKEHKIPIVENPPLARALFGAVEIDEMIPQEHYHAVAEVIGFVLRLKNRGRQPRRPRPAAPNAARIN